MPGYVDLRSAEERGMEERGKRPLDGADEAIAQKLTELVKRTDREYASDKAAYERTTAEIRKIGEDLCSAGGDNRMKQVGYRVVALGGRMRLFEMFWDGICGWMA
ncbi:MAG: hypothetical protein WEA61_02220 [Anaerolineales bacterium]